MKRLIQTSTKERHEKEDADDMTLPYLDNFMETETSMDTNCLETSLHR